MRHPWYISPLISTHLPFQTGHYEWMIGLEQNVTHTDKCSGLEWYVPRVTGDQMGSGPNASQPFINVQIKWIYIVWSKIQEFTSGLVSKQDAVTFVIKFSNFQKRIPSRHTQFIIHDWSNTKDILGRLRLPLIRWHVKIMFKQDLIHYLCYKKYHDLA